MGYCTKFSGSFKLSKKLTKEQLSYLLEFSRVFHPVRNVRACADFFDPFSTAAGVKIDPNGFNSLISAHISRPTIVLEKRNHYCRWTPNADGTKIIWNGETRAYEYIFWITHIYKYVLKDWGIFLSGTVKYKGEERGDIGKIVASDNKLEVFHHKDPVQIINID